MSRLFSFLTLSFAVLVLAAGSVRAETETYEFDKNHTQILFFSDHLGFSKSEGEFLDFDGSFALDRGSLDKSSVEIAIKTASIQMDDEKWNTHMKSEDFFNVGKFPEMTFKSTKVVTTGENTADVTGDLTLLGVTKPVTLHVTHNKSGQHPMNGKKMAGFSAVASLDRTQWGMTYGTPMMNPNIELRIEVEGTVVGDEGTNQ